MVTMRQEIVPNLGHFPDADQKNLRRAVENPDILPTRVLMDLAEVIVKRGLEGIRYCKAAAKVCIMIIEEESQITFLESLMNTCLQQYDKRESLRGVPVDKGTRFTAFMWFVLQIYCHLKRSKPKIWHPPHRRLLMILAKCCRECVRLPIHCIKEIKCTIFVMSAIRSDLMEQLPTDWDWFVIAVGIAVDNTKTPDISLALLELFHLCNH